MPHRLSAWQQQPKWGGTLSSAVRRAGKCISHHMAAHSPWMASPPPEAGNGVPPACPCAPPPARPISHRQSCYCMLPCGRRAPAVWAKDLRPFTCSRACPFAVLPDVNRTTSRRMASALDRQKASKPCCHARRSCRLLEHLTLAPARCGAGHSQQPQLPCAGKEACWKQCIQANARHVCILRSALLLGARSQARRKQTPTPHRGPAIHDSSWPH